MELFPFEVYRDFNILLFTVVWEILLRELKLIDELSLFTILRIL